VGRVGRPKGDRKEVSEMVLGLSVHLKNTTVEMGSSEKLRVYISTVISILVFLTSPDHWDWDFLVFLMWVGRRRRVRAAWLQKGRASNHSWIARPDNIRGRRMLRSVVSGKHNIHGGAWVGWALGFYYHPNIRRGLIVEVDFGCQHVVVCLLALPYVLVYLHKEDIKAAVGFGRFILDCDVPVEKGWL
jgi:hypothetical protein